MVINVHRINHKAAQNKSTLTETFIIRIKDFLFGENSKRNVIRKPLRSAMIVY